MTDFSTDLPAQVTRTAVKATYVDPAVLHSAMVKIFRRLMGFLFLMFFVENLERMNMGFSGPAMVRDLGLTSAQFGFAMTLFYLAYTACGIPANLMLERVGARRWIGGSMIVLGLGFTTALFVVPKASSIYAVRLLTGAVEAGIMPGILLYMTHWFPAAYRARATALLLIAIPITAMIGSALSGYILRLDGVWNLQGWQWLLMLSRIPALIVGLLILVKLLDSPLQAKWLTFAEKRTLADVLDAEHQIADLQGMRVSFWKEIFSPTVIRYALTYFFLINSLVMLTIWAPLLVHGFAGIGSGHVAVGLLAAIPQFAAVVMMVIVGEFSDRLQERRWHLLVPMLIAALGWLLTAYGGDALIRLAGLCLACGGVYAAIAIFWTTPDYALSRRARAVGIAAISTFGNMALILNPWMVGKLHDLTGSFATGSVFSAILLVAAAVLVLRLPISSKTLGQIRAI